MSSSINRVPLIHLDIITVELEGLDNDLMSQEILEFKNEVDYKTSKKGICATHSGEAKFPHGKPACEEFLHLAKQTVEAVAGKKMTLESIWTSTLYKNESVPFHSHKSNTHLFPIEYFSFAYYPRVPVGSASFVATGQYCGTLESSISIEPKEGMMIIFNSFIQHFTTRHDSIEPRIVVSGNYVPVVPNMTRVPDWSAYS